MVVYLILSHRRTDQVLRLARRLLSDDPTARVVIHHDAAAPPIAGTGDERILLVPERIAVAWGDFSVVSAVLESLAWIASEELPYSWIVLLSGQDYPITSLAGLASALDRSGADGFIESEPFSQRFAADNTTRYFFRYRRLSERLRPLVRRLWRLNSLQPFVRIIAMRSGCFFGTHAQRPFDDTLRCYRGSFWWTLSRPCVEYVRAFVLRRPDVVREFARRLVPDEAFFASILASAERFKLVNDDRRYIDWPGDDGGSPRTLLASDIAVLTASGKSFARKFDIGVDAAILDRLDEAAVSVPH